VILNHMMKIDISNQSTFAMRQHAAINTLRTVVAQMHSDQTKQ